MKNLPVFPPAFQKICTENSQCKIQKERQKQTQIRNMHRNKRRGSHSPKCLSYNQCLRQFNMEIIINKSYIYHIYLKFPIKLITLENFYSFENKRIVGSLMYFVKVYICRKGPLVETLEYMQWRYMSRAVHKACRH